MNIPAASPPSSPSAEDRYRAIVAAALDCIVTIDASGRIVEFNPAAERTFGYTFAEVRGREMGQLIVPPKYREMHRAGLARHLSTGEARMLGRRIEIEGMRADGTEFPLELTITRLDTDGAPLFTAFLRDLSERTAAEAALRESEVKFKQLFENSSDAILLVDGDVLLDCNDAAVAMMRCRSREELLQLKVSEISPPFQPDGQSSLEKVKVISAQAQASGSQRIEWMHRRSDGEDFPTSILLTGVEIGGKQMLYAVLRDVTESKRTEAALRASEASYRALFDYSNDGIYVQNIETGAILDVNRRACELHGYSVEEFSKRGLSLLSSGEAPFDEASILRRVQAAAAGQPQDFEWQSARSDGRIIWAEVNLQRATIGGVDRIFATSREITERKRAEAEARERAARVVRFQTAVMELTKSGLIEIGEALREVTETDARTMGVERVSVWFFDAEKTAIVCRDLFELSPAHHSSGARLEAKTYPRYFAALAKQRTISASDAIGDFETSEFAGSYLKPLGIGAMLDVPIWRHGKMIGVICHEHIGGVRVWSSEEQDFATSIADVVSLVIEASEREQAEEALRHSEARFRTMFEQFPLSLQIFSPEGKTLQVNRAWEKLFGLTFADVVNFNPLHDPQIVSEGMLPFLQKGFTEGPTTVPIMRYDLGPRIAARGGDPASAPELWLEVFVCPVRGSGGEIREVILIHMDVSGRKKAEAEIARVQASLEQRVEERTAELEGANAALRAEFTERMAVEAALQRSEVQFRSMIENANDITSILGPDGTILYESPSVARIAGHDPADVTGKSAFEFIHPEDWAHIGAAIKSLFENPGSVVTAEFRFRHKNGTYCFFEGVGKTLLPDSAAEGVVVNSRDISERKRADDVMRAAHETAEKANRAKSEFLSRMSHELRTPMNSILGFGQILARKVPPGDQEKHVKHILSAGRHLLALINEVLDISRIESDQLRLSSEPVALANVIQESINLVQHLATEHAVALHDDPVDEHLFVMADRQRLTQVLVNLLSNGVKYNRREGTVAVRCFKVGTHAQIAVCDTGHGIAEEKLGKLFSPFERLGAENSDIEGTGLGLALSKRLVEHMGGNLRVSSKEGIGTDFWIELPLAADPRESLRTRRAGLAPAASALSDESRRTVLYVEDNAANLSLIETILGEVAGVTLISETRGEAGFSRALELIPDLILLDMHLPDILGDTVLSRLKNDPRTAAIPVIAVSADATASHVKTVLDAGALHYLTKPLDVDRFLDVVRETLRPGAV